jgi:hypothetical protein
MKRRERLLHLDDPCVKEVSAASLGDVRGGLTFAIMLFVPEVPHITSRRS